MKPKAGVECVVPKARLHRFAKNVVRGVNGNVSKACVELLAAELSSFAEKAVQSAWVCVEKQKRKTVLEQDAVKGIETARSLFALDFLDSLVWKLNEMKKEVAANDERRRVLFEADGRGRKAKVG